MSTLKFSFIAAGVVLLLTGTPALWQRGELTRLRDRTGEAHPPGAAVANPPAASGASRPAASRKSVNLPAGGAPPAPDLEAIADVVEGSMRELMTEAFERWAGIEARRTALALNMSPEAERSLRNRIAQFMVQEFKGDEQDVYMDSFPSRTRQVIEDHLGTTATSEQTERWRTLRRQREETEIEKVATDAFHATARLVDLTAEQKDALFKKCSDAARELYNTNWKCSVNAGADITPRPKEPLENDESLLRKVLTPEQLTDWQTLSASQREYFDNLPRRVMGRVFSVVTGGELAEAIRGAMSDADPTITPP